MSSIAGPSSAPYASSDDDDIQMLDSNGEPLPSSTLATAPDANPAEGDQGSDAPEDEYEIEYIVSHSKETTDGQLSYFVKWKGYPDSENCWVFESDMGGAQEMIQEYWAKVPKKGVKKMGTKGGKKGKRQSSASASTPAKASSSSAVNAAVKKRNRRESSVNGETPISTRKSKKSAELAPSRSPTPDDTLIDVETDPALQRIRSDPTLTDDQRELLETQHLHAIKLDRLRKRYARIADWDPIVKRVEAVEKMSDNKLRVFVHFESGDRLAFESIVAHHRCPLKLLQFYESNLRFKKREEGQGEGRVETLRGEEELAELEEYNAAKAGEEAEKQQQQEKEGETQGEAVENGAQEPTAEDVEAATQQAVVEQPTAETTQTEANVATAAQAQPQPQPEAETAAEAMQEDTQQALETAASKESIIETAPIVAEGLPVEGDTITAKEVATAVAVGQEEAT